MEENIRSVFLADFQKTLTSFSLLAYFIFTFRFENSLTQFFLNKIERKFIFFHIFFIAALFASFFQFSPPKLPKK